MLNSYQSHYSHYKTAPSEIESGNTDEEKKPINFILIYFDEYNRTINLFSQEFVENNKKNMNLLIEGKQYSLLSEFTFHEPGYHKIQLLFLDNIYNFSKMFFYVTKLIDISSLTHLDISHSLIMDSMFYNATGIKDFSPISNWDVSSIKEFQYMFKNNLNIYDLNFLEKWDVSAGRNFSGMFSGCENLKDISGITKWHVFNSLSCNQMFYRCKSLENVEPLKNWYLNKCVDFGAMFRETNLKDAKCLNRWELKKCNDLKFMFDRKLLNALPNCFLRKENPCTYTKKEELVLNNNDDPFNIFNVIGKSLLNVCKEHEEKRKNKRITIFG